jgi:hypothetical protein
MTASRPGLPCYRLAAELLVIAAGVLVALGVGRWAQERENRVLEAEYLERLLADVRRDMGELAFILERTRMTAEMDRLALDPEWVRRAAPDSLPGVVTSALAEYDRVM